MTEYSGRLLTITVVILCVASLIACGVNKPNNTSSSGNSNAATSDPPIITASKLHGYSDCPGTILAVTGEITAINTAGTIASVDLIDEASKRITFEGKHLAEILVTCFFEDDQKASLAKLTKGQQVTIQGRCAGKALGAFQIKECVLR